MKFLYNIAMQKSYIFENDEMIDIYLKTSPMINSTHKDMYKVITPDKFIKEIQFKKIWRVIYEHDSISTKSSYNECQIFDITINDVDFLNLILPSDLFHKDGTKYILILYFSVDEFEISKEQFLSKASSYIKSQIKYLINLKSKYSTQRVSEELKKIKDYLTKN